MKHKQPRRGWLVVRFQGSAYSKQAVQLHNTRCELNAASVKGEQYKRALNRALAECEKQEAMVNRLRAIVRSANYSMRDAVARCEMYRVAAEEWEKQAHVHEAAEAEWRLLAEGRVAS